ncbi:hypothetical protein [Hamadaea tsunoensis]|uniref:hypothetical protein n=1 Tax=Hamadaea tsunoensis TaxID=53368 RepID=UPI0003F9C898|nr:hypothetical protein [Hamadaea tsunoensis]
MKSSSRIDLQGVRDAAQTLRVIGEQRFARGLELFEGHCGGGARFGRGNPSGPVRTARRTMDAAIVDVVALGHRQVVGAAALATTLELVAASLAGRDDVEAGRIGETLREALAIVRDGRP